jgi:hypothetical protein
VNPHLHFYPEIPDGTVSEVWHGLKLRKDMDLDALSPMYDDGSRHFYVNEMARMKNGDLVIPIRWLVYQGKIVADAFRVIVTEVNALI